MSYRVFLSHAWTDRWVADQIRRRLENECGASVFIDIFDIRKGDDIEDRIFEAMRDTDELLVLLTPWALDRNWLWVEIGAARALGRRVVPVLYQVSLETFDARGGPTFLRSKNMVEINDLDAYFGELTSRVEAHGNG